MNRSARLGQAVILMMVVALAASCAATKDYSSKIFPKDTEMKESKATALHFLDIDSAEQNDENWVSTDFIMGRDTLSKTFALDKLAQVFPASTKATAVKDSTGENSVKTSTPILVAKPTTPESEPVARTINSGGVRIKTSRE